MSGSAHQGSNGNSSSNGGCFFVGKRLLCAGGHRDRRDLSRLPLRVQAGSLAGMRGFHSRSASAHRGPCAVDFGCGRREGASSSSHGRRGCWPQALCSCVIHGFVSGERSCRKPRPAPSRAPGGRRSSVRWPPFQCRQLERDHRGKSSKVRATCAITAVAHLHLVFTCFACGFHRCAISGFCPMRSSGRAR
jgi:hypothetical protein